MCTPTTSPNSIHVPTEVPCALPNCMTCVVRHSNDTGLSPTRGVRPARLNSSTSTVALTHAHDRPETGVAEHVNARIRKLDGAAVAIAIHRLEFPVCSCSSDDPVALPCLQASAYRMSASLSFLPCSSAS